MSYYHYYIEAEYETGFIHTDRIHDVSPYVAGGPNVLNDIIEKRPEPIHGKLVRFSLVSVEEGGKRFDIDWTTLPKNARPIRFIDRERETVVATGETTERVTGLRFGYQYTDEDGKNHKEIVEVL